MTMGEYNRATTTDLAADYTAGLDAGYKNGYEEGYAAGRRIGYEAGYNIGHETGKLLLLRRIEGMLSEAPLSEQKEGPE